MAKVNVTKRITTPAGQRYYPVVMSANGRIKADHIVVNNKEERYPGGSYYIEWYQDGKRHRQAVGKIAAQAVSRQVRKETELKALEQGIKIVQDTSGTRRPVAAAVADFLHETKLQKKPKTLSAYTTSLNYFQESCQKTYLEQIDRMDLLRFHAYLRDQVRQSPRSCYNKFGNVITFLKSQGIEKLAKTGDWPTYVQEEPEAYEREDLDKFFKTCNTEELVVFKFFLMTGFREQEVMYCTWRDVNFQQKTVANRWKPQFGWTPKAYKEREVPVPDALLSLLEKFQDSGRDKGALLFPNNEGQPDGHFLKTCKRLAKLANLDPDEWWLHKFRATFATWHLQAGVDLRTVQKWLGHVDLDSTMRYLRPARGAAVQAKVNATFK